MGSTGAELHSHRAALEREETQRGKEEKGREKEREMKLELADVDNNVRGINVKMTA